MVGPFARLASLIGLRSVVFFGLQAFIPVYFVHAARHDRGGRQRGAERDAGRGRGRAPTSAGGWSTGSGGA